MESVAGAGGSRRKGNIVVNLESIMSSSLNRCRSFVRRSKKFKRGKMGDQSTDHLLIAPNERTRCGAEPTAATLFPLGSSSVLRMFCVFRRPIRIDEGKCKQICAQTDDPGDEGEETRQRQTQ